MIVIENIRLSMRWTLTLGVFVITAITVLVTVMFLRQNALVHNNKQWVIHTHEVVESIEDLSSKIKDAVLYNRNYLISGNMVFLNAYNGIIGSNTLNKTIEDIEALTGDNPVQQKNLQEISDAISDLTIYLNDMTALHDKQDPEATSATNVLLCKKKVDRIRADINNMLIEETRLLDARTENDEATTTHNTTFVLVVIAIFYIIKLSLSWLIGRQWKQTKALEAQQVKQIQETADANSNLRKANAQLEVLNQQITKSGQARLRAVVDYALDGLITIDARGIIEMFNPACEKIFGYSSAEAIGQNINMLMADGDAHGGYIEHYRSTKQGANIGAVGREVSGRRKDGSTFPMDLTISSFYLDGEEHFSGILRDITTRKQAEAELMRYTRELEHSNQELDDFAYIASHDLKEPLRGLFNHASFLMEDYSDKLGTDGLHRLTRLSQLTQRMEHLVNDLLYFSRLGRSELAVQTIDPNQIITEISQMMEATLKERHARIIVPAPMPKMVCDKPRITEVFRNLITNAAKYNDKPERIIEVGFLETAQAPHGTEKNVFYVKDNGIGIAPEFHQEIFRIFKRLNHDEGQETGTGVGLTFVKKIIERHKGRIWLESQPGVGTTFFFNINQEAPHNGQ